MIFTIPVLGGEILKIAGSKVGALVAVFVVIRLALSMLKGGGGGGSSHSKSGADSDDAQERMRGRHAWK